MTSSEVRPGRAARLAALALVLAAAGCGGTSQSLLASVGAPSAIVGFSGVTSRHPGEVRLYVAVSSARNSELRILNPEDDKPVLGPTLVFPLAIPTDPRPLRLAAAALGDGGADALVVASPTSAAGPRIELVDTWSGTPHVAAELPLAGVDAGAEILSLAAAPLAPAVADGPRRARVVAGLATAAGPRLAVVDLVRGEGGALVAAPAVVKPLAAPAGAFDPLDLAFSPTGDLLFVATTDPLAGAPGAEVFGVAQLAVGADPAADWAVTVLDARAPTRLVAAAMVAERALLDPVFDTSNPPVQTGSTPTKSPDVFRKEDEALRVYAALDPSGCGESRAIRCGIATLVPGAGLAPDPAQVLAAAVNDATKAPPGMPYRAPIEIPGTPLAISTSVGPQTIPEGTLCAAEAAARVHLAPTTGQRCTSAMAVVPSSDGNTYVLDLGRFESPSERSVIVAETTRTRVTGAAFVLATDTAGNVLPGPRVTLAKSDGAIAETPEEVVAAIRVTPGFTETDGWTLVYQGELPGLASRRGVVLRSGGVVYAAVQSRDAANAAWLPGARIVAPELGVAAGDLVQLSLDDETVCPGSKTAAVEATVAALRAPDAPTGDFPGGALQIGEGCWSAGLVEGAARTVTLNVRTSGFGLFGDLLGHVGRPQVGVPFAVEWTPAADPGAAREPADVAQAVARKARRRFYPAEYPLCQTASDCGNFPNLLHPLYQGPAIAFTVALSGEGTAPPRGSGLRLFTDSGYRAMARRPSGASMPIAATPIDRSRAQGSRTDLQVRWYVAYGDDQIFVFGPAEAANQGFSVR